MTVAALLAATMVATTTTQLPPHGGAFVTTLPLGADIWVDGAYVGRTPAFVDLLSVGKHTIVLTRTGWEAQSATIDVAVGQVVQVSLTLAHTSSASASHDLGELDVRGSPAGGAVLVDGKKIGAIPANVKLAAGTHIVTVIGKPDERSTRDVNVYPDTITTVSITAGEAGGPANDILEPVSSFVPDDAVTVAGSQVTIKYRNNDLRCAVGSRAYTLNGKEGLLSIAPAMLSGKLYLPQSLLEHLSGK